MQVQSDSLDRCNCICVEAQARMTDAPDGLCTRPIVSSVNNPILYDDHEGFGHLELISPIVCVMEQDEPPERNEAPDGHGDVREIAPSEFRPEVFGSDLEGQSVLTEGMQTPFPERIDDVFGEDFESESGLVEDGYMDTSAETAFVRPEEPLSHVERMNLFSVIDDRCLANQPIVGQILPWESKSI